MRMFYQPLANSPLYKLWPEGVTGEMIHTNRDRVHIRVPLEGHTERDPKTATIVADWDHVTVI
jgi:hypothetical protein